MRSFCGMGCWGVFCDADVLGVFFFGLVRRVRATNIYKFVVALRCVIGLCLRLFEREFLMIINSVVLLW